MPSPFPGMDPYLGGELWGSLHGDLIVELRRQIIPKLAPRYYPFTEKYFLIEPPESDLVEQEVIPDVVIAQQAAVAGGGVAVAPMQLELPAPRPGRVRKLRLAIRDREKRRLVTIIEFLSPANKMGEGRLQYLAKRDLILSSSVNLVEIDLVHQGQRLPMRKPLPAANYFILVSRATRRPTTDVWPLTLADPLPTIPIPLRKKDADVLLQAALTSVYDLGNFASLVDYRQPPPCPRAPEQAAWLDQRLRDAGRRA